MNTHTFTMFDRWNSVYTLLESRETFKNRGVQSKCGIFKLLLSIWLKHTKLCFYLAAFTAPFLQAIK